MLDYGRLLSAVHKVCPVERFVRRENIRHFRDLLRNAKSDVERQHIQGLLDEELAKQKAAGDEIHPEQDDSTYTRKVP